LEAIDTITGYVTQTGVKEEDTVGLPTAGQKCRSVWGGSRRWVRADLRLDAQRVPRSV